MTATVSEVLTPRVIDALVSSANQDGEFGINAGAWTGRVVLVCGEARRELTVRRGVLGTDLDSSADEASADEPVVIEGPAEEWAQLTRAVPPPGYTDVFSAVWSGMTVSPPPHDAQRHLAIRRLVELLRHAVNGTDAAPQVITKPSRHGVHDAAVGRYVHLDIDGVDHRVYYEEAGSGIPLLCQHTAGSDGRQWRHLLEDERVTSRFRVISYDLPFHGKSLPPTGIAWWAQKYRLTRETLMQVPMGLTDALGLDRPAFIGSSVGGMLALDLGRYHPDLFRAVISCEGALHLGTGAREDDPGQVVEMGEDPAVHAASMMAWMAATAPEAYRQETRLGYAQGAPGIFPGDLYYFTVDHDLRGQGHLLNTPECPVYMLTGDYDIATVAASEQTAKEIPGVHFELMTGLGHFPMSEDPERFAAHLLPILDRIAGT
ncbi:alpha/beta fold hydrolase [Blastococcus sp. URHD0036]|uniref:alpha/beta fold hydrolase n=1 Tax=Blastococcus sp. URHD0036 TaxID=1380356 RepID=UPI00068F88D9|nr:alpha/beta hydrolase [Blastococcus sp. URHD0036]